MGEAEERVLIFRPREEVYAKLEGRILAEAGMVEPGEGTPTAVRLLARHAAAPPPIRIVERVPPERIVIEQADGGKATLRATFVITENPAGSTVRFSTSSEGRGLFGLAARAAERILRRLGPPMLRELKGELEGR